MKVKTEQILNSIKVVLRGIWQGLTTSGRGFIKIEWQRWRHIFISEAVILLLLPVLLFSGYMVDKTVCFQIADSIKSMPEAMYAFLGLPPKVASPNLLFFILFGMMPLNIYLAKRKCRQVIQAVWWDERSGSIHSLLNQYMSRKQLAAYKYLWLMGSFILEYLLWHLLTLPLILIGSVNAEQRLNGLNTMAKSFFMGAIVLIMLQSAAYLYALCKNPGDYAEMRVANWLVFGTLFWGNIYKVRDLVIWLGTFFSEKTTLEISFEGLGGALGWLNHLRWLSPLSWLNPYMEMAGGGLWLRQLIGLVLIGLAVLGGVAGYRRRNIY